MKKSVLVFVFCCLLVFALTACSKNTSAPAEKSNTNNEQQSEKAGKLLNKQEFEKMFSDPKNYKGAKVKFYARVFLDPEKDGKGLLLAANAEDSRSKSVFIKVKKLKETIKDEDIIYVSGTVKGKYDSENTVGGKTSDPMIEADKVEKSDFATAFAPALKTVEVNKNVNQNGYDIKINKIEIADKETRVYVEVTNNTNAKISFYDTESKLLINNQQLEPIRNDEADYPEVQFDILPGAKTQGIICFPKISQSGSMQAHFEGASDNYDLEFQPFVFDINY